MTASAYATDTPLKAAIRIGQSLIESAFWDPTHSVCSWMGRTDVEDASGGGYAAASAALGGHLYGGSSGVTLFLSELYGQTRDEKVKETAAGALRHSVHYLRRNPGLTSALSFHLAHLGAAYAITRAQELEVIGEGIDEVSNEVEADVNWLIDQAEAAFKGEHLLDLLSGTSGAIPALTWLAGRSGLDRCLDLAISFGNELCDKAVYDQGLCYWDAAIASGDSFKSPPLTGFSHGSAGMAFALFGLYEHTGERRYLATARAATTYEDVLFRAEEGNWVDVRFPNSSVGGVPTGTCQSTWCHGAPGIGLTRLLAMRCDSEQAGYHETMARIALKSTLSALQRNMDVPRFDTTLCHGICGLSDIVLSFAEALDDSASADAARTAVLQLVERYAAADDWPSGITTGGSNPTLMIGSSGVGHHLLRLHAPREVRSVLHIQPN
ncbi:MAG: lanthionine synthetase LanC family protein [Blastocatellia bacterium]